MCTAISEAFANMAEIIACSRCKKVHSLLYALELHVCMGRAWNSVVALISLVPVLTKPFVARTSFYCSFLCCKVCILCMSL